MTQLIEALSYPFVQRAIAAGVMISLCAALLGVILVLKQYSLIGHGLGDVGFASHFTGSCSGIAGDGRIYSDCCCCSLPDHVLVTAVQNRRRYSNRHGGNRRFVHWCYYYSDEQRF